MKRLVIILAFVSLALACYASNYVGVGNFTTLTWANTAPATDSAVIKCSSVATNGAIIGVAVIASTTNAAPTRVALSGIYTLSVQASQTVSSIATGDYIWTTTQGAGTYTTVLSNASAGRVLFGVALQSITASSNANVFVPIPVLLRQPTP